MPFPGIQTPGGALDFYVTASERGLSSRGEGLRDRAALAGDVDWHRAMKHNVWKIPLGSETHFIPRKINFNQTGRYECCQHWIESRAWKVHVKVQATHLLGQMN